MFNHYSHTNGLEGGEIADEIIDAKNVLFCFGTKLPKAEMLSLRPHSIGIAETTDSMMNCSKPPSRAICRVRMRF